MKTIASLLTFSLMTLYNNAVAGPAFYPPGNFAIDGMPVNCGNYPTILNPRLPDSGMFNGQSIMLNPVALSQMPTSLKLYVYAHECAHGMGFLNESDADCVAIKTGRNQGWFPPQQFNYLVIMFQNNPGSLRHPPGLMRVRHMADCYKDLSS